MRGVVNAAVITLAVYALIICAITLPHHPCDALSSLPWLHCHK